MFSDVTKNEKVPIQNFFFCIMQKNFSLFWCVGKRYKQRYLIKIVDVVLIKEYKGIGDAGSTADLRMLWSAIVCLGLL